MGTRLAVALGIVGLAVGATFACGETLAPPSEPDAEAQSPDGGDAGVDACVADLTTDPKNCGRCGHDCLGGGCAGGKCEAVNIIDFNLTDARCAVDAASPCYSGTISGVALDDTYVYFGDHGGGSGDGNAGILRVRKDAVPPAKPEPVTTGISVREFSGNESSLFLQFGTYFFRVPKAGGPGYPLSSVENLADIRNAPAIVGTEAWFGTRSGLRRIAVEGTPSPDAGSMPLLPDGGAEGSVIAVAATNNGDRVVWATYSTTDTGFIRSFDRASGVEKLAGSGQRPVALAVEGDIVYWVNANGDVRRADLSASTIVPTLLAKTDVNAQSLVLAGDDLYVTTWGPNIGTSAGIVGSVFRIPKVPTPTAEGAELVFRGPVLATGLAVDERAIYFGGWWTGGVLRIAR